MKKLLVVAALMVASFSFANEKTTEIVLENVVQTVSVETQQTETMTLTTEELLTYCWTTVTMTEIGSPYENDMGQQVQDYLVHTRTSCMTV
ncbi:hypothetical protein FLGE108171_09555 [Flavobacterium gelidilacus]|jgi:hypothetical protein|uniref:hypothetical protein n=1 Tax=Flavobacterium gelidilacus TaxID=206041 RepID=UPI0004160E20|nr:hypothetical protein [Flavobacterium gelidilacus]